MRVFYYDKTFEGLLSVVFDAYIRKEFPQALLRFGEASPLLVTGRHDVKTTEEKAQRVFRGLSKKLTENGRKELLHAWLSDQEGHDMAIFRYLCKIIEHTRAETDLSDHDVFTVHGLARQVCKEKERMAGFTRFQKTRENVYFAAIMPRHDVLPLLAGHFSDRFADHDWLLYDLGRAYGLLRSGGEFHEVCLDEERLRRLKSSGGRLEQDLLEDGEALFQELWRAYFKAVAIRERSNPALQSRCMPRRYWSYMTEKQ